jgi:enterobactin synthetase component F
MGGLIALEIGLRLDQLGEKVALLGMLDTWGPRYPRRTSLAVRVLENVCEIAALRDWPALKARLRRSLNKFSRNAAPQIPYLSANSAHRIEGNGALVDSYAAVNLANVQASASYQIRRYPGRVVLLRATRTFNWPGMRFDDPTNGLEPFAAGGVSSIPIDCTHLNMLDEPHIEQVGRSLQMLLDEVRP